MKNRPEVFGDDLVMELRVPVKVGDAAYTSLELSEPTGEQLIASELAQTPTEGLIEIIRLQSRIPASAAKQLRKRDLQRAADFFNHFGLAPESAESLPSN